MDIYSLLFESLGNNDIAEYTFSMNICLLREKLDSEVDKKIFDIICIFLLELLYDEKRNTYIQNAEITIGEKSLTFQKLTEEDYKLLKSLDFQNMPLGIKARVLDVLWVCKKDYKAARMAADAYRELFINLFDEDNWTKCFKVIKRAIVISAQIGKNQELYKDCCQEIYDKIVYLDGKDSYCLSIRLLEIS